MSIVDSWMDSHTVKNYEKMAAQSEKQQEMLEIMEEVADGFEKSEARKKLESLTEQFLSGGLDAEDFRDAYTDYYTDYETEEEDDDDTNTTGTQLASA
ncbi:MAG: hypothetical protein HRT47_07170 [Candidatus Caenarcaniphilales bacterium]|nr:hypothetical protein [Candidatus Caenarcaniphilales bacterium]